MADASDEKAPPDEHPVLEQQEQGKEEEENKGKEEDEEEEKKQKAHEPEKKSSKVPSDAKDKKKTEEKDPITVEIPSVKKHYNIHNKSTLRHVLTEYGFEDKDHKELKTSEQKKEQKRKKKKKGLQFDAPDDDENQKKMKDEVFRQKFGDNRSTDKYYEEYLGFLERKVQQQRIENQKRKEEEERRERERLEEEENSSSPSEDMMNLVYRQLMADTQRERHVHKRLQRIELSHDDSFLKKLPKTDLARIVELESKLKREGKLKSQSDMDKFWDEINQPDVFYSQFKRKKSRENPHQPLSTPGIDGRTVGDSGLGKDGRSLSHISEHREASRISHHDNWAITQQFTSQHSKIGVDRGRRDSTQIAKEAALELEKRFPKLEMPKMSCFSISLGEKPPDPEEIQRHIELKAREKSRKKYLRKLRKMHQLAMAHSAAATRILAERGDIDSILNGANLRDVLAVFREDYVDVESTEDEVEAHQETFMTEPVFDFQTGYTQETMEISETRRPGERRRPGSHSLPSSAGSSRRLEPIHSVPSSRRSSKSRRKKKPEAIEAAPVLEAAPLTYTDMSTAKIVEAKCLSSNWNNYMHAGKSVYSAS